MTISFQSCCSEIIEVRLEQVVCVVSGKGVDPLEEPRWGVVVGSSGGELRWRVVVGSRGGNQG